MGTNYYLRLREPRVVRHYDYIHIAKRSYGWLPLFQAVEPDAHMTYRETPATVEQFYEDASGHPFGEDTVTSYSIHSVEDIRRYLATGNYEVVDENGEVLTPEEFEKQVIGWNGGCEAKSHREYGGASFVDPEGFEFERGDFV